jgi:peptidoglycan/xylan/chitin deacetylase (PgdA/CDA1 family)
MTNISKQAPVLLPSYHLLVEEPSRYRYSSTAREFREHLSIIDTVRRHSPNHSLAVTFDDAHSSQFHLGYPLLQEKKLRGIFFAVSGWVGRRQGYMTWDHLRRLLAVGHEVQSHSASHQQLTRCSETELENELVDSKTEIEQRLGAVVDAISIPNGRWNDRVLQGCVDAGYRRIYTSDPIASAAFNGAEVIGRWMVTRTTTAKQVRGVVERDHRTLQVVSAMHRAKCLVRAMVSEEFYDRAWGILRSRKSLRKTSELYVNQAKS